MASPRSLRALSRLSSLTTASSRPVICRHRPISASCTALLHPIITPNGQGQRASYAVERGGRKPKLFFNWGTVVVDGVVGAADFDFVRKDIQGPHFTFPSIDYLQCLRKFSRVATAGQVNWVHLLKEEERPSPELLHETGCILREMGWVPNSNRWSYAMWTPASEMGFTPSTITMVLYLIRANSFGQTPMFKSVETRFQSLVTAGQDPNALTVSAELRYRQGMHSAAIRLLSRAREVGGDDFAYRGTCELLTALSYQKLGNTGVALEHFRIAARYQLPEAVERVALLSDDPDESYENLYAAACRNPSLFTNLAEAELEKSATVNDKTAREEAVKWANEWSNLANPDQKI